MTRRPAARRARRAARVLLLVLTLAATAGCGGSGSTPAGASSASSGAAAPATADKVTYLTAFGIAGRDAFAWVAQSKGYYRDAGLDVTIQPGAATGENLKALSGGRAQFAALDLTGAWITAGKGQAKDVRAILAVHQQSLVSIIALEGSGIAAPQDLAGKTLGAATGSVNQLLFPAYAAKAGLDPKTVKWANAQPAQLPTLLATGRVDALSTFLIARAGVEKAAGKKAVVLPYASYLPDLFGNGVVTTTTLATTEPDLVRRFRAATLRALRYTVEHPAEAAQILARAQPAADPQVAQQEIAAMIPAVGTGDRIGSLDRDRVTRAIATLHASGVAPAGLTADDVVDFTAAQGR